MDDRVATASDVLRWFARERGIELKGYTDEEIDQVKSAYGVEHIPIALEELWRTCGNESSDGLLSKYEMDSYIILKLASSYRRDGQTLVAVVIEDSITYLVDLQPEVSVRGIADRETERFSISELVVAVYAELIFGASRLPHRWSKDSRG